MIMPSSHGRILIHVTGNDYPGILAKLTWLFENKEVSILDVQQTTSLRQLSLSLLLEISNQSSLEILGGIHQIIKEGKLDIDITVLTQEDMVRKESSRKYALTVLSPRIKTSYFNSLVQIIAKHNINIERMNQLAQGKLQCIELVISLEDAAFRKFDQISRLLFQEALRQGFDLAIQPESLFRRSKRLIVMDMDSTLIQQEVIDELADMANVKEKVASITRDAMQGKLNFTKALHKRVALLKGLTLEDMEKVKTKIVFTSGAETLVTFLKKLGFKIGVISGGFTYFTSFIKNKLNLDYDFANELEIKQGKLTGDLKGDIIDRAKKAVILKELAAQEKISLDQTVAIGDGANDIDMLSTAGLGIAFNAKPKVREEAKAFLSLPDLASVLFLLGVSEQELLELSIC